MQSSVAALTSRGTNLPLCFARRAGYTPCPQPVRCNGRKERHSLKQWRLPCTDSDSLLVPPSELESLAISSLETVDPSKPHVDVDASVWYVPAFLDAEAEDIVAICCEKLRKKKKMKKDHSFAAGRRSAMVPVMDKAYGVFSGEQVIEQLKLITSCEYLRCGDYPVEARLYLPGAEMQWHRDVRLYEVPQLELIFTVDNDSNATTQWLGSDGVVRSITPKTNSLLLFTADGAWHRVVQATEGERTIIKALYCSDETLKKTKAFAELLEEAPWRR